MAANQYNGEIDMELDGKVYPMKINMGVIGRFQSETGNDYMHVAMKAINALRKAGAESPLDQAEIMTAAVSMTDAAWLFFLAAKEVDKTVTFDEMQEAVLKEGPLMMVGDTGSVIQSYPVLFANLVMFSTLGAMDIAKKP